MFCRDIQERITVGQIRIEKTERETNEIKPREVIRLYR